MVYARVVAATPSLRVVKQFTWKGQTRQWSNRYHFNGGLPADSAHWTTFSDAVVTAEKTCFSSGVTIVQTYGYAAGSDVPVFAKTYSTTGTLAAAPATAAPQDAALVRYATTARTPKNHPVYLFNYVHDVKLAGTGLDAQIWGTQRTALSTYAGQWISGFSDGTLTLVRAGPNGATAVGSTVGTYPTHRDFPT